jgi:hypothetical protein
MNHNYFVRDDYANPQLITCSAPLGYPTVAAAKEAKVKEIQEEMRFHLETIGGLLNDIEQAKEQQSHIRLYCEINGFLSEIEKARSEQEKVRKLSLRDASL